MKTNKNFRTRLLRVARIGTAFSAALLAACALQAQYTGPTAPLPPLSGDSAGVSASARIFMHDAAQANQTEIAMAGVAEARSQNSTVKELARMMRKDHQQNYDLLQTMAQNHLVVLESSLNLMNQRAVHHLQKAGDADFDKEYTKVMLKDHVKCITMFDKAIEEVKEPYVREYAQNTMPALRKHLRHAEEAARSAGVDEATITSILKGLPGDEALHSVTVNQN
jgi:putative membrane protein